MDLAPFFFDASICAGVRMIVSVFTVAVDIAEIGYVFGKVIEKCGRINV